MIITFIVVRSFLECESVSTLLSAQIVDDHHVGDALDLTFFGHYCAFRRNAAQNTR